MYSSRGFTRWDDEDPEIALKLFQLNDLEAGLCRIHAMAICGLEPKVSRACFQKSEWCLVLGVWTHMDGFDYEIRP